MYASFTRPRFRRFPRRPARRAFVGASRRLLSTATATFRPRFGRFRFRQRQPGGAAALAGRVAHASAVGQAYHSRNTAGLIHRRINALSQKVKSAEATPDNVILGSTYQLYPTTGKQCFKELLKLGSGDDLKQITTDESTEKYTILRGLATAEMRNATNGYLNFEVYKVVPRFDTTTDPATFLANESKNVSTGADVGTDISGKLFFQPYDCPTWCSQWKILWRKKYTLLPGRRIKLSLHMKNRKVYHTAESVLYNPKYCQVFMIRLEPNRQSYSSADPAVISDATLHSGLDISLMTVVSEIRYRVIPLPEGASSEFYNHSTYTTVSSDGATGVVYATHVNPTSGEVTGFSNSSNASLVTGFAGARLSQTGMPTNEAP